MTAARKTVADSMADLDDLVRMFPGASAGKQPTSNVLPTININGTIYGTPFVFLWQPLEQLERNRLKARLSKVGMTYPPVTYESPRWGLCVIDGFNRAVIAEELRIPVPDPIHQGKKSDEWAFEEAKSLNRDRRQSTKEQLAAVEKRTIDSILDLQRDYLSERGIAARLGISREKVRKAGGSKTPPDDSAKRAGKVTGQDGKSYPPRPYLRPLVTDEPEPDPTGTADLHSILDNYTQIFLAAKRGRALTFTGTPKVIEDGVELLRAFGSLMNPYIKPNKTRGKFKDGTPITPATVAALFVVPSE